MLDLTTAFDTIYREYFEQILTLNKLNRNLRTLWKNALKDTKMKFKTNETGISLENIDLGVFQGSPCSPLQFQIYGDYINKKANEDKEKTEIIITESS